MAGAVILAGRAALRGGAGLVQLAVPTSIQAVVASGGDWESVNTISEMSSASFVIRVERVKVRTRGHSNDLGPKLYPLK